jgi:hypothetical protein
MKLSFFSNHVLFGAILAHYASASTQAKPYIVNTVERGMNTECKTCPWTLCTNTVYYESEDNVTLTCWTHGTEIAGDR